MEEFETFETATSSDDADTDRLTGRPPFPGHVLYLVSKKVSGNFFFKIRN